MKPAGLPPKSASRAWSWAKWGMLVAAVFVGGRLLGWSVSRYREARDQRELIATLHELDAHAYYDYQLIRTGDTERLADDDGRDSHPHWLAAILGKDLLHRVFYVSFAQFRGARADGRTAVPRAQIDDEILNDLTRLRGLRWVALNGTGVTDTGLEQLAMELPIERLWLSQTRITDRALSALSHVETLTHLSLEGTSVSDQGVSQLARLPRLMFLSLGNPRVTDAGIETLRESRTIRELYLDFTPVGDDGLRALRDWNQLEVLSLRHTRVTDAGVLELANLTNLRELRLDDTPLDGQGLVACRKMSGMRSLSLSRTGVTDESLLNLAACRQLESLNLRHTPCSLAGVYRLFVERQQRTLADALAAVATVHRGSNGKIQSLDLEGLRVTDEDMRYVAQLDDLSWLSLSGAALTDEALVHLAKLQRLTLLNLNHSQITNDGLLRLAALSHLRHVHVAGSHVDQEGIEKLRQQVGDSLRVHMVDYEALRRSL